MRMMFVDDERRLVDLVLAELPRDWVKHAAYSLADAERIAETNILDVVVLDLRLPDGDGLDFLAQIKNRPEAPEVFVLTGHGSVPEAVHAMRLGVFDFVTKPVSIDTLESIIRAGGLRRGIGAGNATSPRVADLLPPGLHSLGMQCVEIAKTDLPILICGEPGIGKERFAQFIHDASPRSRGPFIVFDCASAPSGIIEAKLFGSSQQADQGRLGAAAHGTLVLKHMDLLSTAAQARLIHATMGSQAPDSRSATRLIGLTDSVLQLKVSSGEFSEDLFFLMSSFALTIPPLRRRADDVMHLARQHLVKAFAAAAEDALRTHVWPGNVTELLAVLRLTEKIAESSQTIRKQHVEAALALFLQSAPRLEFSGARTLEQIEREHIQKILHAAGGNQSKAAKMLGIDPKTLYRKLKGGSGNEEPS